MFDMIYTSYFANVKNLIKAGIVPISIARYIPRGIHIESWIEYAPEPHILHAYKQGKLTKLEYKKLYLEQLSQLDITKILRYDGIALVCYEKPDDFCHRHILADELRKKLGAEVEEWTKNIRG
jgi:uncharacterized protein YeaO (DUF488 family)